MEKKELKQLLITKRMQAKAEIEKYNYLSQHSKVSYQNKIDELLDLITTIDKALKELD